MIDRLQSLHESGYVHADLKPDNILTACKNRALRESSKLVLIDFGISSKWIVNGLHVPQAQTKGFFGN